MKCPYCASLEDKVVDSREIEEMRLMVVKKDGRREAYDRQKILRGLRFACHKRNVDAAVLEKITDEIERQIVNRYEREVLATQIGELVMDRLRQLDHVAYVRFASVYRQFRDVTQFRELVEVLDREDEEPPRKVQPRLPYA